MDVVHLHLRCTLEVCKQRLHQGAQGGCTGIELVLVVACSMSRRSKEATAAIMLPDYSPEPSFPLEDMSEVARMALVDRAAANAIKLPGLTGQTRAAEGSIGETLVGASSVHSFASHATSHHYFQLFDPKMTASYYSQPVQDAGATGAYSPPSPLIVRPNPELLPPPVPTDLSDAGEDPQALLPKHTVRSENRSRSTDRLASVLPLRHALGIF